jgi:hypothetical protein
VQCNSWTADCSDVVTCLRQGLHAWRRTGQSNGKCVQCWGTDACLVSAVLVTTATSAGDGIACFLLPHTGVSGKLTAVQPRGQKTTSNDFITREMKVHVSVKTQSLKLLKIFRLVSQVCMSASKLRGSMRFCLTGPTDLRLHDAQIKFYRFLQVQFIV